MSQRFKITNVKGESMNDVTHLSSCTLHNEPALPIEPCNCGAYDRAYDDAVAIMKAANREYAATNQRIFKRMLDDGQLLPQHRQFIKPTP